ncbi:MAG: ABC transporter permease [Anaerolineaceae bacterium]|nr:ABC transporter permease [Anaerolineaceae bacterium]
MNKVWIVFKTEFINTVTRRSFLITLILVPLLPSLILGALSLFGKDDTEIGGTEIPQTASEGAGIDGYVDLAGIITTVPDWIQEGQLPAFDTTDAARTAIEEGKIQGFYVISQDYLETGSVQYYLRDFNPFSAIGMSGMMDALIEYNLLGADQRLFEIYANPTQVEWVDLTPTEEEGRDISNVASFYVPYGVTLLFYFLTFSSASLLLNSIAKEKENRIMEILMNAMTPRQLLTGKILALGLVGLLQLVVWLGTGLALVNLGGTTLNIPAGLQLSPTLLFWGVLFFITGYLIYATIMAGVGALVPNLREASQATFMVIIPLLIPLFLASNIIEAPDTTLPLVLSLIPFTATSTIMTRLAVGSVPLWQILTSLVLMIATFIFLIRAVAKMFQTQLLLTGQKFSIGLYLKYLLGKEATGIVEQKGSVLR